MARKGTKRTIDPLVEKCDGFAMAIRDAADLPKDVVTMLVEMIPHCLGQPKEKRHRFQENGIQALDKVLHSIEENYNKNVEGARAKLSDSKGQNTSCEEAVVKESHKLHDDSDRFTQETKILAKTTLELRAARKGVQDALKSEELGGQDLESATEQKRQVEVLINDFIEPLKSGSVPEQDVDKRCKSLLSTLTDLDLDESMLIVLGASLCKTPSKRGDFDQMALDQLDKFIAKYVAAQDQILSADEVGGKERAAAVGTAQGAFDVALEAQKVRAEAFETAWKAKEEDVHTLQAARRTLKEVAAQNKTRAQALYKVEAEFDVFEEYARKTFEELKDWSAPVPEPAEKVADTTGELEVVTEPQTIMA